MRPEESRTASPQAQGVRLEWKVLPARIVAALEEWAESTIASVASQVGGFSPGIAVRLRFADGRRVFVKAVGSVPNPDSPAIHRREAQIVAALPSGLAVPRLLWSYDEGDPGWVLLAFEDIEGRQPAQPWQHHDLERVLTGLADLAAELTPSPLLPPVVRRAADQVATQLCGWRRLRDQQPWQLARLDDWSLRHLDASADLETRAPAAVDGDTLLHFDVRADNVLLTPDRVWFVDWPWAGLGAAWVTPLFSRPV